MDQVLTFDKSFQQRLQEYKDVLLGSELGVPVSRIETEWGLYLELVLDPNGWQAVWKIPRSDCESFKIAFPSVVLVFVLNVDYIELVALVQIVAVQDDIHLPEKHYVPLMQLWPTKDQDKSIALNIHSTANALDMLRFFYTHVFMPWDYEDDTSDWVSKNLETRLRLYYDMKNGMIPRGTAEHIHSILTEARRLQTKKDSIETELSSLDVEDEINPNNKKIEILQDIHIRLLQIRGEIEILENPILRSGVIRQQQQFQKEGPSSSNNSKSIYLIFEEGKASDYITFLNQVKDVYPSEIVKFSPQLSGCLENSNGKNVYILNESQHVIRTTGALETGGTLKGLNDKNKTVVTSQIEDVMLDFKGNVTVDNVTIEAKSAQCAILIRKGKVTLSNCKIIGDGCSSTHQGIIVLAGGELEIIDSEITGFHSAIVGNSNSKVSMKNVKIYGVHFGLKVYDYCAVNAENASFQNCKEYGICVETDDTLKDSEQNTGSFNILNIIPDIKVAGSTGFTGVNNAKGDVIINHKSKIKAIRDIFGHSALDKTIFNYNDSNEEEMDTDGNNCTVTENIKTVSV